MLLLLLLLLPLNLLGGGRRRRAVLIVATCRSCSALLLLLRLLNQAKHDLTIRRAIVLEIVFIIFIVVVLAIRIEITSRRKCTMHVALRGHEIHHRLQRGLRHAELPWWRAVSEVVTTHHHLALFLVHPLLFRWLLLLLHQSNIRGIIGVVVVIIVAIIFISVIVHSIIVALTSRKMILFVEMTLVLLPVRLLLRVAKNSLDKSDKETATNLQARRVRRRSKARHAPFVLAVHLFQLARKYPTLNIEGFLFLHVGGDNMLVFSSRESKVTETRTPLNGDF